MDDWHRKVARHLVAFTPSTASDDRSFELELSLGRARGAFAYVLELARAHRIAAAGGVAGDDIWVQIATERVRLTLNRRESCIVLRARNEERKLQYEESRGVLVDDRGVTTDVEGWARGALEKLIDEWRKSGAPERLSSIPPQPDPSKDDEPTKG